MNFKRINRNVLLKYLDDLKVPVSGFATKDELLQILFQKWNLPYPSKSMLYTSAPPPPYVNQVTLPFAPSVTQSNPQFQMMFEAARVPRVGASHDPLAQMIRSKEVLKEVNSMAFNEYIVGFARTFYDLFNNPSHGRWLHGFNDTHFFGESKAKIMIKGANEDIELESEGIEEVLVTLSNLKKEHQLYFSPNLTEQGVRSKRDHHGLVSAVVCGTLHQRSGPVGVFEQCFILSTDPFARESYKILETVLILRSSNAVSSMTELMLTSGRRNDEVLPLQGGSAHVLAIEDSK
jgi:hypothetical protein